MLRAVDGFRGVGSPWLPSEPLGVAGQGQLREQHCHFSCVADVLEQVPGAEQRWSRSSGTPRQGAVCWGCPTLQRVLPARPPACLTCQILAFSLACGVPFPTRQLGLGPRLSFVADREALRVRSLQGSNSIPWQRRVQVGSSWVWLWLGPGSYFSRHRVCSGIPLRRGQGVLEEWAMSELLSGEELWRARSALGWCSGDC